MEPKPKERIVFDEDSYYGDEGEKMAINDLMERKGLTEDEVRESFTDDEVFQHAMKPPSRASLSRRTEKPPSI